jgi:hypothetical protein
MSKPMHIDLIKAIHNCNMEEVKKHCHKSIINANYYDDIAIILATERGHLGIIEYLIQEGANVNATNNTGTSALMVVNNSENHLKILDLLIQNGANINIHNRRGQNALDYALDALTSVYDKDPNNEAKYFARIAYLIDNNIDVRDFKLKSFPFESKNQVQYYQKIKSLIDIAKEKQTIEQNVSAYIDNEESKPHKLKI